MKKKLILGLVVLTFGIFSCSRGEGATDNNEEIVVVANRGSASISFVNARTDELIKTTVIQGSEPMYVVYVPSKDRVYVGDRAQSKVHVVNPSTMEVERSIGVGKGVFHMWAGGNGSQLWVNNNIDNTTSVISLETNTVVQTIDLEVKPHDVFVTQSGNMAYISVLAGDNTIADSVYAYNAINYQKVATRAVGEDPHLYHIEQGNNLYVPNQSGKLFILNGDNLSQTAEVDLEGAHGIFPTPNNEYIIITNLPGGQLYSINAGTLDGKILNTTVSTPHNVTVNTSSNKAFVTHSGATANRLTIYQISDEGSLTLIKDLVVGTNPFGLAYYKREIEINI